MDLRVLVEPQQGLGYPALARAARAAAERGFGGFFSSDHYLRIPEVSASSGHPGPLDAWTSLAGLARETTAITLGTLVTSATFRTPRLLATQVGQVHEMSGGRVAVGLGLGWYHAEHTAYGIPFPSARERFARCLEHIAALRHGCPGVPLILGGRGTRRTPALAAEHADEFNVPSMPVSDTRSRFDVATGISRATPLVLSSMLMICTGRTDHDVRRRLDTLGLRRDDLAHRALIGTPAEVVDRIGHYAAAGAERLYLKLLTPTDLAHLDLIAEAVLPQVRPTERKPSCPR